MKSKFLGVLLTLISFNVFSKDYFCMVDAEPEDNNFLTQMNLLDMDSIKKLSNNLVKFDYIVVNLKNLEINNTEKEEKVFVVNTLVNCATKTYKMLNAMSFGKENTALFIPWKYVNPKHEFIKLSEGSKLETMSTYACKGTASLYTSPKNSDGVVIFAPEYHHFIDDAKQIIIDLASLAKK